MGDSLKGFWEVYSHKNAVDDATSLHLLAAWVNQVCRQATFALGSQHDAAECLMHILLSVDRGEMQKRQCDEWQNHEATMRGE